MGVGLLAVAAAALYGSHLFFEHRVDPAVIRSAMAPVLVGVVLLLSGATFVGAWWLAGSAVRPVYEITEQGREEATRRIEEAGGTPWEVAGRNDTRVGEFRNAVRQLLVASKQVSASGNQQQVERMLEILKRARKEIYTMLAED